MESRKKENLSETQWSIAVLEMAGKTMSNNEHNKQVCFLDSGQMSNS
jgi:hypothetical protein